MSRRLVGMSVLVATILGLGGLSARQVRPGSGVHDESERRDAAIAFIEQALARDPQNPALKGQLISRLIVRFGRTADLADVTRAEELATSAINLTADRSGAFARLSGIYLMQHKFTEAFESARTALANDTGSAEARGTLLEAALASGQYRVADSLAARLDQPTISSQVRRALWLDAQGHTEQGAELLSHACRELERSAGQPEGSAWCQTQLAGMVHSLRGPDEAERLLTRVLGLAPGYRGAVEGLANLALAQGRPAEALAGFRKILSDAHPDLYLRMADAHRMLGQHELASAAEQRFLAIAGAPEVEALFGHPLAMFLAERGDPVSLDSALAIARREIVRRPTNESFDLLGWVLFRRGNHQAALAAANRALSWGAPSPTLGYHRARILAAVGRTEEAATLVAEAVSAPTLLPPHVRRDLERSEGRAGS